MLINFDSEQIAAKIMAWQPILAGAQSVELVIVPAGTSADRTVQKNLQQEFKCFRTEFRYLQKLLPQYGWIYSEANKTFKQECLG